MKHRCSWAREEPNITYHDTEWGVPVHDEKTLFEFLILEGAQAGLSWTTVLNKRDRYREVFDTFDPKIVAQYDDEKRRKLLNDQGIIRNRLKIDAAIQNAKAFLEVQHEFSSFDAYIWHFVNNETIINTFSKTSDYPTQSTESENMSKDLRKRGFKFVGPTICYAFMQAIGMVNDHEISCFRKVK